MNRDLELLPRGSRVLCAVSGGADSMCLLHWLKTQEDLKVFAAHFEHGLRGEESLRDAAFVTEACAAWGIPCAVEHGNVPAYARAKGLGIEEAARELRYEFLERTADSFGCDRIATAHNADDNAETVLLNLCRGSGAAGLTGIPVRRGRIVRPLLPVTRQEIEAYLRENGIDHVEDSSNGSDAFSRNRLRHQVLPVLRELNPRFAQAVGRTAGLLREDEDYLSARASAFLDSSFDGESLSLEALCALHPAIASRVLRALCPRTLEQTHVNAALRFIRGNGLGSLNLPGLRLWREQGKLYLKEPIRGSLPDRPVRAGERVDLPEAGLRLSVDEVEYHGEIYDLFKTYLFKCENICGTLYCTGRRPGDRLHPQGRNCGKSLHDLFREAGMTQIERDRVPVLRDDRGVLAVLGFPADERVRPAAGDRVLRIRITEILGGLHGASD